MNTDGRKIIESKWIKMEKIGVGSYGIVYKGMNQDTKQIIAIKKMKSPINDDGISVDALREIVILKNLECENIISLYDVVNTNQKMYLIFEYMNSDLTSFIESFGINQQIPLKLIKEILKQILKGLRYLNMEGIMHRDLKPQNVLINYNKDDVNIKVKLADFGLARTYSLLSNRHTKDIMTPLYRAPEVFVDTIGYSPSIDIWSVGCIFAELINKTPLFNANSQIEVLIKIFQLFGNTESSIKFGYNFKDIEHKSIFDVIPHLDSIGLDLICRMLEIDPEKRISAYDALEHEFFKS